jgi:hypothetical protein
VIVSQSRRRAAGGGGRNPFDNFEHVGISNLNATVRLLRFCKDNESMVDIEDLILENLRHVRTAVDGLRDDMREVRFGLAISRNKLAACTHNMLRFGGALIA